MKCPRCERENREGRRFCAECGASLALACPSCGFSNEPGENFCGGCGARLGAPAAPRFSSPEAYTPQHLAEKILTSKSALEGERKQVTVLFADLKGSMELLADRDPEEARKILDPVLERMMEAVHRYEGTVNQPKFRWLIGARPAGAGGPGRCRGRPRTRAPRCGTGGPRRPGLPA